jgi:hypothetical protein
VNNLGLLIHLISAAFICRARIRRAAHPLVLTAAENNFFVLADSLISAA